ncbi:pentapeptide repeat-containing protein [Amycolatopsis sp. lyj-112]|uniref:pentapeptide repeat-containing protein n=1 Tax=Amycolatopsis sp. lyj-112 TaxID=2789288 RepID=UPI00397DE464
MVMVGVHVVAALAGVALGVGAVYLGRTFIEGVRRDRRERPALLAEGLRHDRWEQAVEKLDSDDASERLACFADLERYGRENPDAGADILELACSYLRKPFEFPAQDEGELEIRLAAQQLLTRHLRWPEGEARPADFWEADELELQDAVLIDPDFADAVLVGADFRDSLIVRGDFRRARFPRFVTFDRAYFTEDVRFDEATFGLYASFAGAMFGGTASFAEARFQDDVTFTGARVEHPHAAHSWPSHWRVWANSPAAQGRLLSDER